MLSLFFIDEVDKYKCYDAAGQPYNGIYAEMFEQEYEDIVGQMQLSLGEDDYIRYLKAIIPMRVIFRWIRKAILSIRLQAMISGRKPPMTSVPMT